MGACCAAPQRLARDLEDERLGLPDDDRRDTGSRLDRREDGSGRRNGPVPSRNDGVASGREERGSVGDRRGRSPELGVVERFVTADDDDLGSTGIGLSDELEAGGRDLAVQRRSPDHEYPPVPEVLARGKKARGRRGGRQDVVRRRRDPDCLEPRGELVAGARGIVREEEHSCPARADARDRPGRAWDRLSPEPYHAIEIDDQAVVVAQLHAAQHVSPCSGP
jgi:hypothetical protein